MKILQRFLAILLTFALALPVYSVYAADMPGEENAPFTATVQYVEGEASVLRAGETLQLLAGNMLLSGDIIETGAEGMVVAKLGDGRQVYIGEHTSLEILTLAEEDNGNTSLYLEDGNVISVIDRPLEENEAYTVETSALIMAIRGTIASVNSEKEAGESRVALFEGIGSVQIKDSEESFAVPWGEWLKTNSKRTMQKGIAPKKLAENEKRFLFSENLYYEGDTPLSERLEALLMLDGFERAKNEYTQIESPIKTSKPTPKPTQKPTAKPSATAEKTTSTPSAKPEETPKPTKAPAPTDMPTAQPTEAPTPQETEKPAKTEKPEEEADGISLKKAKSIFSSKHPDAEITVAKKEGDVYYIEGENGNTLYKMKIKVDSGKIVLDKEITTGKK